MRRSLQCGCRSVVALAALWLSGCNSPYMRFPNLQSPGPAGYQRAAAIEHDPYPLNDIGPEIVGGRPLAYQQPVPETVRTEMAARRPRVIQQIPVPSLPGQVTAAPVLPTTAAPYSVAQPIPQLPPPPPTAGVPFYRAPAASAPIATPPPVVTTPYSPPAPQSAPFQQRSPY
jgi:hypothetical protein